MRLYDTRRRMLVTPTFARTVRMYVCGVTPYDATHLGHAFTYSTFDVLLRRLEALGHRVRYTRNVTDVDDDMLRKASELNEDAFALAKREVAQLIEDLSALGLRAPEFEPWASEEIPAISTAVAGLVTGGKGYLLDDGRVYFNTAAATQFNDLAKLERAELERQFAEKGGDPEAPGKRDRLDFLLWQPSTPGEPSWPHPVDPSLPEGRPGWHIECSVMASETLGNVVDIHGGGDDLVYPHHEAEILQAEGLSGQRPFARVWMHVAMVGLDGEKMSKSRGNLVFVRDLRTRAPGAAIRRYLLEHHYRSAWDFKEEAFTAAVQAHGAWAAPARGGGRDAGLDADLAAALDDDLDTPTALALLDESARRDLGETLRDGAAMLGLELP